MKYIYVELWARDAQGGIQAARLSYPDDVELEAQDGGEWGDFELTLRGCCEMIQEFLAGQRAQVELPAGWRMKLISPCQPETTS